MGDQSAGMKKIFEVLLYQSKIKNDSGMIINDLKGDVEFDSVSFRYPGTDEVETLKNVSFKINLKR